MYPPGDTSSVRVRQVTPSLKHYCYRVSYARAPTWHFTTCCARAKNATLRVSFGYRESSRAQRAYSHPLLIANLTVACYAHGPPAPLRYPVVVRRGEPVVCRVTAAAGRHQGALLVVPNCSHFDDGNRTRPVYFVRDK